MNASANPSDSNSRREAIIDIAAQSFAGRGFHGVSMRNIAKANDSSVATLYNYFDSKDALMLAIGQRFYPPFLHDMDTAASAGDDGLHRLLAMAELAFNHCRSRRNEFLTLSHDVRHVRLTEALAPMTAWRGQSEVLWRKVLDQGMADGSIQSEVSPSTVILIIFYAITGMLEAAKSTDSDAAEDPITTLVALLSEGLRPRS